MDTCGLAWNVIVSDWNSKTIKKHNIFDHGGVMDELKKAAKKYAKDRDAFELEVRRTLRYYYWCKCEWEVVVSDWPPRKDGAAEKIDVYWQVAANWQQFIDYLWAHAIDLRRREKKKEDA